MDDRTDFLFCAPLYDPMQCALRTRTAIHLLSTRTNRVGQATSVLGMSQD